MKYKRRVLQIEAHRLSNKFPYDEGAFNTWAESMGFQDWDIIDSGLLVGEVRADPGDWIIREDNEFKVYTDEKFKAIFEDIPDDV